ncbi:MAG: hypothetical protein O2781_03020 [Bacteroidetes bacterium]|nr:hypothetical protein [Bacteroidota bacterium]
MKKLILLLFAFITINISSNASFPVAVNQVVINEPCDQIILKNGDEIAAIIIEITPELIKYKKCNSLDGPLISIYNNEVFMVRYKDGSKELFDKKLSQKNDSENALVNFSGISILSLSLSVLALFILGIPFGFAALILGIVAMRKENKLLALAILGAVIGLIDIILVLSYL